jgi:hypothetical protein
MVERGVLYSVGSYCSLLDDIACKFESNFYQRLDDDNSVEESNVIISSVYGPILVHVPGRRWLFQCDEGEPTVKWNLPLNNIDNINTPSSFFVRKEGLIKLYTTLNRIATCGKNAKRIYTINGDGGQGKTTQAVEVAKRTAHLFPVEFLLGSSLMMKQSLPRITSGVWLMSFFRRTSRMS